jgi:hypothetical protein
MISRVDIKSIFRYGYERDLGLRCRLLGDQNKNIGTNIGHYNEKKTMSTDVAITRKNIIVGIAIRPIKK